MTWGMHTKDSPGKGRVLVVDDEENVRKLVRVSLTKAGYDVEEAGNGEEAEKIIRAKDNPLMVDVILCDIRMPKVNGIEAIAFFQKEFPSVPIVVITGFPDTEVAVNLLKQGVMDYVRKPIDGAKLLDIVAKAMAKRASLKG
jgi:two-component system, chemotaxis family, chemotaxis protein CheY